MLPSNRGLNTEKKCVCVCFTNVKDKQEENFIQHIHIVVV